MFGIFTKDRLGPCTWGRALRLGWARGPSAAARTGWGASAAARTDLGSCRLGNCTFGKLPLGKYPWEVAAWGNAFFTPEKAAVSIMHCFLFPLDPRIEILL